MKSKVFSESLECLRIPIPGKSRELATQLLAPVGTFLVRKVTFADFPFFGNRRIAIGCIKQGGGRIW